MRKTCPNLISLIATGSAQGVTLFELLVTITLIGILSAIVFPGLQGILERNQFNSTKDDILQSISVARNRALANDQGGASGETDCSWDGTPNSGYQVYFSYYKFFAQSNHYDVQQTWKKYDKLGNLCHEYYNSDGVTPKEVGYVLISKTLPSTMHFDFGLGSSMTAKYSTSASQVTLAPSPYQFKLIDDKLSSDNLYYICFDRSGLPHAQKSACP
jgi:prepilin-type N-terminal cleavage/methylation domain-containing protein